MSARRGVVALGSAVVALGVWAACSGGLKLEEGNAFPCRFQVADELRDAQCPQDWRCGIDGLCHETLPEQTSDVAVPTFAPERRFPKLLSGEARYVSAEEQGPIALTKYTDGGVVVASNAFAQALPVLARGGATTWAGNSVAMMEAPVTASSPVTLFRIQRDPVSNAASFTSPRPIMEQGQNLTGVRAMRAASVKLSTRPGDTQDMLLLLQGADNAGEVDPSTAVFRPFPKQFSSLGDGGLIPCNAGPCGDVRGAYLEARPVPSMFLVSPPRDGGAPAASPQLVPVVATSQYFLWRSQPPEAAPPGERWQILNPDDPIAQPDPSGNVEAAARWVLRHSDKLGVWALRRFVQGQAVLSTWVLSRSPQRPQEPRLERLWDDCSPCARDSLVAFTPVADGALGVEVLCESGNGARSLFRIVGASVVSPTDTCLRQALEAPLELSEVASVPGVSTTPASREVVADQSIGYRLTLGGKHGQVWRGTSLSQLRPMFLDRTPLAVEVLPATRQHPTSLITFTPGLFAIQPPTPPQQADSTGLSVVMPMRRAEDGGSGELVQQEVLGGVVEGTPGWFLLEAGQLAQVSQDDTQLTPSLSTAYGPRLLSPSGESAQGPFRGTGVRMPSDAGVSLVLAADDQLYYTELGEVDLVAEPELAETLSPRLTPESNFPVLSLARDRTVSLEATQAGAQRVRGWAVTSRSAFEFWQEADTLAWKLKALELSGREPVEVWSREAGGNGYGRLGLRDGQVLRLPQGVPLTQALPQVDRVVDYATLDGWPIALGEQAVYRVVPLAAGETGLPGWQALTLPPELDSQALKGARIFVVRENNRSVLYLFTRTGFVYQLGRGAG
ncbi:hypothetical protein [Hyalangium gracile]|uniref:hypothetical protein n=1 Tax=Hyalangium gracile TaxID=394092 RepID=UPI001CCB34EA|nr:hypothetical protein [Hyalangium gracile]